MPHPTDEQVNDLLGQIEEIRFLINAVEASDTLESATIFENNLTLDALDTALISGEKGAALTRRLKESLSERDFVRQPIY